MKQVSKDEFYEAVRTCQSIYTEGVCRFVEPPVKMYYKGVQGDIFGKIEYEWFGPNGEVEHEAGQYWKYYLEEK